MRGNMEDPLNSKYSTVFSPSRVFIALFVKSFDVLLTSTFLTVFVSSLETHIDAAFKCQCPHESHFNQFFCSFFVLSQPIVTFYFTFSTVGQNESRADVVSIFNPMLCRVVD